MGQETENFPITPSPPLPHLFLFFYFRLASTEFKSGWAREKMSACPNRFIWTSKWCTYVHIWTLLQSHCKSFSLFLRSKITVPNCNFGWSKVSVPNRNFGRLKFRSQTVILDSPKWRSRNIILDATKLWSILHLDGPKGKLLFTSVGPVKLIHGHWLCSSSKMHFILAQYRFEGIFGFVFADFSKQHL